MTVCYLVAAAVAFVLALDCFQEWWLKQQSRREAEACWKMAKWREELNERDHGD